MQFNLLFRLLNIRRRYKLVLFSACLNVNLIQAQLPETDLWLAELNTKEVGKIIKAINITNRAGYDNQPSFSKNGKLIYFTSIHEDKQADIYSYNLKNKKTIQLTKTKESEYSPNESPIKNSMAVVTVLQDSSQVIQLLDLKTFTVINSTISNFDSVGYYNFLNADTVLYYKLTSPHTLKFHVISNGNDGFLCENPCRTFRTIDRSTFIFGIKDSASTAYYIYDVRIQKANLYARIKSVNEDLIWDPAFGLLVSDKATILRFDVAEKQWKILFDLSSFGIKKITRFCFDSKSNYLCVVNNL